MFKTFIDVFFLKIIKRKGTEVCICVDILWMLALVFKQVMKTDGIRVNGRVTYRASILGNLSSSLGKSSASGK